jgi:hypothetical protein
MKNESVTVVMGGFLLWFALVLTPWLVGLWLVLSLGTSVIKTATHQCGTRYKIESVVSGDWFCS